MQRFFLLLACLVGVLHAFHVHSVTDTATQIDEAYGVIGRVLGISDRASLEKQVVLHLVAYGADGQDRYSVGTHHLSSSITQIKINATSGVALASGFYRYFQDACGGVFAWDGQSGQCHQPFPEFGLGEFIVMRSLAPFRYYLNVCTVSYSSVWWNTTRWRKEIDWMALHGINLPLAFVGNEYVWYQVYSDLGLTDEEIQTWMAGPAFLAWQRMGNLRKFGGPLPMQFMKDQMELQKTLLKWMRGIGMVPVLPGFGGHVPSALRRIFPHANYTTSPNWWNAPPQYCCNELLQPGDPLYTTIGDKFYNALGKITDSEGRDDLIFNADTFNEMDPESSDPAYLAAASRAVYSAMQQYSPKAKWLMQGWLFADSAKFWTKDAIKAYLSGAPNDGMFVLDLWADVAPQYIRTDNFFGKPYVWCLLHNFGQNLQMFGALQHYVTAPFDALNSPKSSLNGFGLTMEGIEQNPVVYETMARLWWVPTTTTTTPMATTRQLHGGDKTNNNNNNNNNLAGRIHTDRELVAKSPQGWTPRQLNTWLMQWASMRYQSHVSDALTSMWTDELLLGVYQLNWAAHALYTLEPKMHMADRRLHRNATLVAYAFDAIHKTTQQMSESEVPSSGLAYDAVDITRQAMSLFFEDCRDMMYFSYQMGNQSNAHSSQRKEWANAIDAMANQLCLPLLKTLDEVLGTNENFLLGTWVQSARTVGHHSMDELYTFNALNQITIWGDRGEITDYASKEWAGLVKDYYMWRWQIYQSHLTGSLRGGNPLNETALHDELLSKEQTWGKAQTRTTWSTTANTADWRKNIHKAHSLMLSEVTDLHFTCYSEVRVPSGVGVVELFDGTGYLPWTRDTRQLVALCHAHPLCAAVDTAGRFYSHITGVLNGGINTVCSRDP